MLIDTDSKRFVNFKGQKFYENPPTHACAALILDHTLDRIVTHRENTSEQFHAADQIRPPTETLAHINRDGIIKPNEQDEYALRRMLGFWVSNKISSDSPTEGQQLVPGEELLEPPPLDHGTYSRYYLGRVWKRPSSPDGQITTFMDAFVLFATKQSVLEPGTKVERGKPETYDHRWRRVDKLLEPVPFHLPKRTLTNLLNQYDPDYTPESPRVPNQRLVARVARYLADPNVPEEPEKGVWVGDFPLGPGFRELLEVLRPLTVRFKEDPAYLERFKNDPRNPQVYQPACVPLRYASPSRMLSMTVH